MFLCCLSFLIPDKGKSQVTNYISNGSFEDLHGCNGMSLKNVKSWLSIDSIGFGANFMGICNGNVPLNGNTYQKPRTGNNYLLTTWFWPSGPRGYMKNRLKSTLRNGKVYCVKFYINIANSSPYGMDGFGIYFGNNTIDTITQISSPLVYLNPQVKNPIGNAIKDTLNWVLVTGTFTANGTEKYAVLGNFLADNAVTSASIGGQYFPQNWTDVCIDDVSCIDVDLPAFAGHDTNCIVGTSVYIGRQSDVGIDEACMWYKLPITITPTTPAIDTAAGIWVSPTQTSTYVVRQEICGHIKWDTVIVYQDFVGLNNLELKREDINIYPNPTKNKINFTYNQNLKSVFNISISNLLGQFVLSKNSFKLEEEIDIGYLPAGIYYLKIEDEKSERVFKVMKN